MVTANAVYFYLKPRFSKQGQVFPPLAQTKPAVVPPPVEMLGNGARMPTPQELEEEARFDERQVNKANEWLKSPQVERRIAGVEQLSAYQNPQSQKFLIDALRSDADPQVRRTAAQRFSAFKEPSEGVVNALLSALEDVDASVQMSALNTLMGIMNKMPNNSALFKKTLSGLKKQAASRRVAVEVRKAVSSFLKDQSPSGFFGVKNK